MPVVRRAYWGRPIRTGPIIIIGAAGRRASPKSTVRILLLGGQRAMIALCAEPAEPGVLY